MTPQWHGSVGWVLTARDGTYCGRIGSCYPCDSLEDGWRKAIEWLRKPLINDHLVRTFEISVRYF